MTRAEEIKQWILDHPEWEHGPKTELMIEKLKRGDAQYLWNVYMAKEHLRESLSLAMHGERERCRFCWKFPESHGEEKCRFWTYPMNHCFLEHMKFLPLEIEELAPGDWISNDIAEAEEERKILKIMEEAPSKNIKEELLVDADGNTLGKKK